MASKRSSNSNRKRVKSEYPSDAEQVAPKPSKAGAAPDVKLRLRINARYITYGPVTGLKYEFDGAGSVAPVSALDAPGFLLKNTQAACCSGNPASPIFEVVGE